MRPKSFFGILSASFLLLAAHPPGPQAAEVTFAELAPILQERCVICHSGPAAPLGLRLDSLEGLHQGSQNGPVIKAGDPTGSELIRRLKGLSQPRMPLTGPPFFSDQEIARFERWIVTGFTAGGPPTVPTAAPTPALPATTVVTYAQIAPLLSQRCVKCHTENGLMGPAPEGYLLTSYAAALTPAERARVVPGRPAASELVRRLRGQARPRMPFDGPPFLTEGETDLITAWVRDGARDADGTPGVIPEGARVRLHGVLTGRWRLDTLPLTVSGATRFDKNPDRGDYVEVRGRVTADGEVVVDRIRPR